MTKLSPVGERRWVHFTSAQFLMQAVNRSIRYLGLVHSSIGSMHISLKWSKQVLQEWFEEKMFKFSIFYGRSWHKIKYPVVAFPSRFCLRWSETLATSWMTGDGIQQQLSGWFSVSSIPSFSELVFDALCHSTDCAQRPSFRSIESGKHPYLYKQLDLRCYIVKLRIQGCRYWV